MANDTGGVWRTVGGRKIFIKEGQEISDAMKESGKFKSKSNKGLSEEERKKKIEELEKKKEEAQGFFQKGAIQEEIDMVKDDFEGTREEYRKYREEKRIELSKQREQERANQEKLRIKQQEEKQKQLEKEISEATPEKKEQYEIIQKNNPMTDDYHAGIRSPKDIKTWEEAIEDEESFGWGDFNKEDAKKALESGEITVYSSYDIKQGTFVSTSKAQAEEYAGGKGSKVFERKVPINEVAWINGDEGQYAKISKKTSSTNVYMKAYNEYKQEHPNSKITFTQFKKNME